MQHENLTKAALIELGQAEGRNYLGPLLTIASATEKEVDSKNYRQPWEILKDGLDEWFDFSDQEAGYPVEITIQWGIRNFLQTLAHSAEKDIRWGNYSDFKYLRDWAETRDVTIQIPTISTKDAPIAVIIQPNEGNPTYSYDDSIFSLRAYDGELWRVYESEEDRFAWRVKSRMRDATFIPAALASVYNLDLIIVDGKLWTSYVREPMWCVMPEQRDRYTEIVLPLVEGEEKPDGQQFIRNVELITENTHHLSRYSFWGDFFNLNDYAAALEATEVLVATETIHDELTQVTVLPTHTVTIFQPDAFTFQQEKPEGFYDVRDLKCPKCGKGDVVECKVTFGVTGQREIQNGQLSESRHVDYGVREVIEKFKPNLPLLACESYGCTWVNYGRTLEQFMEQEFNAHRASDRVFRTIDELGNALPDDVSDDILRMYEAIDVGVGQVYILARQVQTAITALTEDLINDFTHQNDYAGDPVVKLQSILDAADKLRLV